MTTGAGVSPGFARLRYAPNDADLQARLERPYEFHRGWLDTDGHRVTVMPTPRSEIRHGSNDHELLLDVVTPGLMDCVVIRPDGYIGRMIFDHLKLATEDRQALRRAAEEQEQEIIRLRQELALERQRAYGTSSEQSKDPPTADAATGADASSTSSEPPPPVRRGGGNAGRKPLPKALPEVERRYEQPKCLNCGSEDLFAIGEDIARSLVIVPETFCARKTVQVKYVCRCCKKNTTAPAPRQAIPGSSFGSPEFVAHVATHKYYFGMPNYRQVIRLNALGKPYGLRFNRTTLNNLMIGAADLFTPICEYMHQELLTQAALHADETIMQVLNEPGKTAQSISYMWGYRSTKHAERPVVYFDYQPSRAGIHAANFLRKEDGSRYDGWVHTDGYAAYDKIAEDKRIGCAAHVRRRFEAICKMVGKLDANGSLSAQMLDFFRKLYAVEKDTKDLDPDTRAAIRRQICEPILKEMYEWLDHHEPLVLPKSPLGRAIHYAREHLPAVARYLEDGRLALDNNIMERAIKMVVIGRKNWLFAHSQDGAVANAVMYTMVQSAIANGVDPYRYLMTVLERLPQAKTAADVQALLPWALKDELSDDAQGS